MNNLLDEFINKNDSIVERYKEIIEDMLNRYSSYHYAESTLIGIWEYIEKNGQITEAQRRAVDNIKSHPSKRG